MIFYYKLKKLFKKLYIRATFAALVALLCALSSSMWGHLIPDSFTTLLGASSVDTILQIIASNMLMVVTFSLATMVAGYTSASQGVTPRAASILIKNQKSQNSISIFLGAFIFSTVSIIALSTKFYGIGGRFILFVITCILIFAIVWTIIRWIEDLSKLGRVHETIMKIEESAQSAFKENGRNPYNYCNKYTEPLGIAPSVLSNHIGYIQQVDYEKLNRIANKIDEEIYVNVRPGSFVHTNKVIVYIKNEGAAFEKKLKEEINSCFVVDDSRSYDSDPRFNLIVLSEVSSRALSPGVNDPGTAIDALTSATKVLHGWISLRSRTNIEIRYSKIFVREMTFEECFADFFRPITRDGAEYIEVVVRVLKAIESLASIENSDSALTYTLDKYKKITLSRSLQCLKFEDDKKLLQKTYSDILNDFA